jgi:hypothetical protein
MDYARTKRLARARFGEPAGRRRLNLRGWRTEYPDQFPVTTTRKDCVDNDIRPIDGNGHTPDDDQLCACCLREDPAYKLGFKEGYEQALLKLAIAMLEQASIDATVLRDQLERLMA